MITQSVRSLTCELDSIDGHLRALLGLESAPPSHSAPEALTGSAETLTVLMETPHALSDDRAMLLATAAMETQSELRRTVSEWRTMRLRQLTKALERLVPAETIDDLRRSVCVELTSTLGYGIATYSIIDEQSWTVVHVQSHSGTYSDLPLRFEWTRSPTEHEALVEKDIMIARNEPTVPSDLSHLLGGDSYLVAPVSTSTHTIGLLHCASPNLDILDFVELDIIRMFASVIALLHERDDAIETRIGQRTEVERAAQLLLSLSTGLSDDVPAIEPTDDEFVEVMAYPPNRPSQLEKELTAREREVFRLLVSGASNQDIADRLVISLETVKSHVKRVLRKIGAVNRAEAASLYLQQHQ